MANGLKRAHRGSLKSRRQETRAPVVRAVLRNSARIWNRDIRWKIRIFAAKRVTRPRPEAREPVQRRARGQEIFCGPVCVAFACQGMNERNLIRELGQMRKHVRNPLASLSALQEVVLRAREFAGRPLESRCRSVWQRLPVPLDQLGFVVPCL